MSSTTQASRPGELDRYYTPVAVALACVATLGIKAGDRCLEPHAGRGAFVGAMIERGAWVRGMDLDPDAGGLQLASDAGVGDFLRTGPGVYDWIVGNPPYNDAEAHIRHALGMAPMEGCGFLLRLAFLETAKRAEFWRAHPPAEVHVLVRRPSFTGGATDSAAYGWFVWRTGHGREPVLRWLDWSRGAR